MDFQFRRIKQNEPGLLQGATWLGDCRLLFLEGMQIGHVRAGRFYGSWDELLYLNITNDSKLLNKENGLKELEPGLYVEISETAQISEDQKIKVKPGIREINEFLRLLQTKKIRGNHEDKWKVRSNLLRKVRDFSASLDIGLYEIVIYDRSVPAARQNASLDVGESIQTPEDLLVRNAESAAGGISEGERKMFRDQMIPYRKHALRTEEIDRDGIKKIIDSFYQTLGLEAPHVVIFPNPLSAAVAGAFAAIMLFREKHGIFETDSPRRIANFELISSCISSEVSGKAERTSRISMDAETLSSINELIEREFVAGRFSDDTLRFMNQQQFTGFDLSYIDPEWTVDCACIRDALKTVLFDTPEFVGSENVIISFAVQQLADQLSDGDDFIKTLMLRTVNLQREPLFNVRQQLILDSNIEPVASFSKNVLGLQLPVYKTYAYWERLVLEGAAFVMHKEFCFVSNFPEYIEMDERNRLHCQNGPALKWRDGWCVYHWHGTPVPKWLIESPEAITVDAIRQVENQEFRRVMIERYGVSRFLIDSGAVEIHRDEFGALYRQNLDRDEALVMVRVTNSTAEPDGSFKEYFLRVPPAMDTAKGAVAWSFGFLPGEYNPTIET